MTFEETLDQAIAMLQRRGRVTYRALKRQFNLDDDFLEDLKVDIIKAQRLAVDEGGEVLIWTGGAGPTGQRDPDKDSIAIRADVFKHAAIVAGVVATIYTTFFLTGLKEVPPQLWILIAGIIVLLLVAGFSVYALSNLAIAVRKGRYGITSQATFAFRATSILFAIGFILLIIFTIVNARWLVSRKTQEVGDAVQAFVAAYTKDKIQTLQHGFNDSISQVDSKLQKAIEDNDKIVRQYIDDKFKGTAPGASPSGAKPSP